MSERQTDQPESGAAHSQQAVELTQELLDAMPNNNILTDHSDFLYRQEAPLLQDIVDDDKTRDNLLYYDARGAKASGLRDFYGDTMTTETEFTERQAIQNLDEFYSQVLEVAQANLGVDESAPSMLAQAQKMKQETIYIGEPELAEAIQATADYWAELIAAGTEVYLLTPTGSTPGYRSHFYLTLRMVEEFNRRAAEQPDLQEHLHVGTSTKSISDAVARVEQSGVPPQDYRIIFNDDFALTRSQLKGIVGQRNSPFKQAYFADHFEANLIAGNDNVAQLDFATQYKENPAKSDSKDHYTETGKFREVVHYKTDRQNTLPITTGSHSSTDNPFEADLATMQDFMRSHNRAYTKPLPIYIRRPYEEQNVQSEEGVVFDDPSLLPRWKAVLAKYGLPEPPVS